MVYTLRHFDTPLLRFSATEDTVSPEYTVLWADKEQTRLLPLDIETANGEVNTDSLATWIKHRTIPKNRAYVTNFLAKCGLSVNRPLSIISVCKGLSLNDCYWVTDESFDGEFAACNLYENKFSEILAYIAFTGYGSSPRSSLLSSPEFTTNGMLPKCWRRIDGKVYLYKGGTAGASNTGNEPYSEYYAYQVAQALGMNAVPYQLHRWKGVLCSSCELFTSKEYSYMPVGNIVRKGGIEAVSKYYQSLGKPFVDALNEMLVFDAVICNTDRHFGNFGFLVDNSTNTIAKPAPLFDHGNSLFSLAAGDCWTDNAVLEQYAQSLQPCVYDDFIATAKAVLTPELRERIRHLLAFRFRKDSRYNLPPKRLKAVEQQIQKRVAAILE